MRAAIRATWDAAAPNVAVPSSLRIQTPSESRAAASASSCGMVSATGQGLPRRADAEEVTMAVSVADSPGPSNGGGCSPAGVDIPVPGAVWSSCSDGR
jgi:hypothetical protein